MIFLLLFFAPKNILVSLAKLSSGELRCPATALIVLRNTSGSRVKFVDSYFPTHRPPPPTPPPMVVYATDRSNAVSRCCSYSVLLCGLYYGALHVLKSSRAPCPHVSSFLTALWTPRLGKRELVCVFLVHLFVCFVRVSFIFHFSLPLGVGGWLLFVIVALPGLFYLLF